MSTKRFEVKIVTGTDGNIDVENTLEGFRSQLAQYAELHSADVEKIEAAMNGVFEANPALVANVPALTSIVMQKVWSGDPSSYGPLSKRVSEVLHASETICIEKGPGKGARLRSAAELSFYRENGRDQSPEEKKLAQAEALKAAARK